MRHRTHAVKLDLIPCGRIEAPKGELQLRNSTRVSNTVGLAATFETARQHAVGAHTVLIPRPSAYVLLKLLSFLYRRASRDLRYVIVRNGYDPSTIWDDSATQLALENGSLEFEDLPQWFLGRDLGATFHQDAIEAFLTALDTVAELPLWHKGILFHTVPNADERLLKAERWTRVLRASVV